jgi:hypothetical protein
MSYLGEGPPPSYGIDIKAVKKLNGDSTFFLIGAGRANLPIGVGNYSFPFNDSSNFSTSVISFYDKNGKIYMSGGDEIYGTTFYITTLNKKRVKGWFKGKLVDEKADTVKASNTIYVEGRFNVSLKNAQHYRSKTR